MKFRVKTMIVDAIISAVVCSILIQWSLIQGKLAVYPAYDDVTYLHGGLLLLRDFHIGLSWFLYYLCARPPHSPVTELLTMASFALCGVHDWAPYAGNGLLLFVVFRILRHVMDAVPPVFRWCLTIVVLMLPIIGELVTVLRPDLFYGLAMAATLLFILTRPVVENPQAIWVKIGLIVGGLFLIKTSVYPQTVAILGLAVVLRSIRDVFGPAHRLPFQQVLRAWGTAAAIAVLVAAPHYIFALRMINHYIAHTLFGADSTVWRFHGSVAQQLGFYLFNTAMLSREAIIIAPMFVLLAAAALAWSSRGRRWELASVLIMVLTTYLLPTLNRTKSSYLGVVFQSLVVLAVLCFTNDLFQKFREMPGNSGWRWRWSIRTLCVAAACLSVGLHTWPAGTFSDDPDFNVRRNRTARELFAALHDNYGTIDKPRLMLTTVGEMINIDLFEYLALKEDNKWLIGERNIFAARPAVLKAEMDASDFIIAAEAGTSEIDLTLDSSEHVAETLAIVRARDDIKQIAAVTAVGGGKFYVFAKRSLSLGPRTIGFSGFSANAGLGIFRGPDPQAHLPLHRVGLMPATVLTFDQTGQDKVVLDMNVESVAENQKLTIRLNGRQVAQFVPVHDVFRQYRFDLMPRVGTNEVEIEYSAHLPPPQEGTAVLFQSLRIIPASELSGP